MKRERKYNIALVCMTILPIILMGIIISVSSYFRMQEEIYREFESELTELIKLSITNYELLYPGDFSLTEEDDGKLLYKGETCVSKSYDYIDRLKEDTGLEFSIFYDNERYATTVKTSNNLRAIGTKTRTFVYHTVVEEGNLTFYREVSIGTAKYSAVYAPLTNEDGTIVGMMGIAKPADEVSRAIGRTVLPGIVFTCIMVCIVCFLIHIYIKKMENCVRHMKEYTKQVSEGDLNAQIHSELLKREDELGEIAKDVSKMQFHLRRLLEYDVLTDLYNRGTGEKKLKEVIETAEVLNTSYAVAIGDIDFFKTVNDTYGHAAGDAVLRMTAQILKEHMGGNGYTARWGGEEFLLIFRGKNLWDAAAVIEEILEDIRSAEIKYEDTVIPVTMTFGLVEGEKQESCDRIVTRADKLLYEGKKSGKNRLVKENI